MSAAGSLGNALSGGGSLQASFLNEHSVDEFSIVLLVHVLVINAHQKMRDVRLNDDAFKLMESQGSEDFRKRYGDQFVVGMTLGGEFVGLINYKTRSESQRTDIEASLKAGGGLGSWSASADFSSKMQSLSTKVEYEVFSLQIGGADRNPVSTIEQMIKKAIDFPNSVQRAAEAFTVELQDYDTLPLPVGKNPLDVQAQRDQLTDMARLRSQTLDQIATLDRIRMNPDLFEWGDITQQDIADQSVKARQVLDVIHKAASECFNDYKKCQCPVDLRPLILHIPKQKALSPEEAIEAQKRLDEQRKKEEAAAQAAQQQAASAQQSGGRGKWGGVIVRSPRSPHDLILVKHLSVNQ